jgi:hypothetical protein
LTPAGSGSFLAFLIPLPFFSCVGSVIFALEIAIENWPLDARM